MIIGLTGYKSAGKDTVGQILVEKYSFARMSFTAKMKESAAACFGIDPVKWEEWKNNPRMMITIDELPAAGMEGSGGFHPYSSGISTLGARVSVREFLQNYGTEAHRDIFGEDFWVNQIFNNLNRKDNTVFTDCRMVNEADAVIRAGGIVIRVDRGIENSDTHSTETPLEDGKVHATISNTGTIEDLHRNVASMMEGIDLGRFYLHA